MNRILRQVGPADVVSFKGDMYKVNDDIHLSTSGAFRKMPLVATTFKVRTQYNYVQQWARQERNFDGSESWPGIMYGDPMQTIEEHADAVEAFFGRLDGNMVVSKEQVSIWLWLIHLFDVFMIAIHSGRCSCTIVCFSEVKWTLWSSFRRRDVRFFSYAGVFSDPDPCKKGAA